MKWLFELKRALRKQVWWRFKYKKCTLDETSIYKGRCIDCSASNECHAICKPCPCKFNQHLQYI